jgi:hypothetical protein
MRTTTATTLRANAGENGTRPGPFARTRLSYVNNGHQQLTIAEDERAPTVMITMMKMVYRGEK